MTQTHDDVRPPRAERNEPSHVVGLGASAGGIKPLQEFFRRVATESGASYVVILHLSPDHDSKLAEVLQTTSPIAVTQVTERVRLEPDHAYVIPPNKGLEISDGHLVLKEVTRVEQRKAPIDVFFRTLAETHRGRAACVVLSGTGADGSSGLKRVKECGGLAIAQLPDEADHRDMPKNAIGTGLVDYVIRVGEMPQAIANYFARLPHDIQERPASADAAEEPEALREVLRLVRVRTGHDFSNYKTATLRRRIQRRMTVRGATATRDYAELIRQEPDEAIALMRELLISVTNFFRDAQEWSTLEDRIIPRLFFNKTLQDQVRVWVPGCATGEEAYSLAMLLAERAAELPDPPAIQVFATDLDEHAIAIGREGFYTAPDVAEVPEARLARFFHRDTDGYRIKRELRELVLFAQHNVIRDPPFSHLDLISCRNLLIYLNRVIQERVVETFHFALRPGGFLFLGTSESPEGTSDLFLRFDATSHIYESRTGTSRAARPLDHAPLTAARLQPRTSDVRPANERLLPVTLHQRLLEEYAAPSLVATEEHTVVHMSERVGRYLQVPAGEPSRDLLALVRPELRPDLRTALHQAAAQRRTIHIGGIVVLFDDGDRRVNISVKPMLRDSDPPGGFFLVLFDEMSPLQPREPEAVRITSPSEPMTREFEEELARVQAQLRTTIEQYETQVEEAKASNEELQAMNEELRSSAEELETSKEELQSVNEELTTVNQELKIKIEELALTNNDFQNFINATDMGLIFLDRALRVKFSTARAQDAFNLRDSDMGRPLTDITSKLRYDRIHTDVRSVLDRLQRVECEVETTERRWLLMRMLPYRTADNRIDGVVLTFQDVTARLEAEMRVRQGEERMRLLIDGAIDYAIFTLSEDGRIDSWNSGAERMFGYSGEQAIGKPSEILFTPEDRAAGAHLKELDEARRTGRAMDERFHLRRNGTRFYCSGVTTRLGSGGLGFAKIARDLTPQRDATEAVRVAHADMEERVRQRTVELREEIREHQVAKQEVTRLLHRLVDAQEQERARISRDLHDQLGQQLTALRLTLERLQAAAQGATAHEREWEQALTLTRHIGRDIDFLAWELRPSTLDELGLVAALPRFVNEWSAHVGIPAEMRVGAFEPGLLPRDAEVAFYRVAQEALNNVAKHAHATRVDLVLSVNEGKIVLVVEDDGVGFDPAANEESGHGFGLAGMRERAALVGATLQVESAPGHGTAIYLRCPVPAGRRATEDVT